MSKGIVHVKDLIPIGIQCLFDHGGRPGLFAADSGYSKGVGKAWRWVSQCDSWPDEQHDLRNTSLLYNPSAAMTEEVRLGSGGRTVSTPTGDPKIGFATRQSQRMMRRQRDWKATHEGKFAADILPKRPPGTRLYAHNGGVRCVV